MGRLNAELRRLIHFGKTGKLVARHPMRWPYRIVFSILGWAKLVAFPVASARSFGSVDRMIDVTVFRAERHDAQVAFGTLEPMPAVFLARIGAG